MSSLDEFVNYINEKWWEELHLLSGYRSIQAPANERLLSMGDVSYCV